MSYICQKHRFVVNNGECPFCLADSLVKTPVKKEKNKESSEEEISEDLIEKLNFFDKL